ncbi:MAG: cysteine-rich KTR domain-containing protein [Oscillospiraceae bacterium]|nr:cysteine-rich KTR domain-containing protein [Oscillospiraceae bacterium]
MQGRRVETKWIRHPVCGNKIHIQIRKDTVFKNFSLYHPKCIQEILINVRESDVLVLKS